MFYRYQRYSSHYRALISLGVPIVIGQIGNVILGFADTLMIGRHSMFGRGEKRGIGMMLRNSLAACVLIDILP